MLDAIKAILDLLWALLMFRYSFIGLFIGMAAAFVFDRIGPDVAGEPGYFIVGACFFGGFLLDIWYRILRPPPPD